MVEKLLWTLTVNSQEMEEKKRKNNQMEHAKYQMCIILSVPPVDRKQQHSVCYSQYIANVYAHRSVTKPWVACDGDRQLASLLSLRGVNR